MPQKNNARPIKIAAMVLAGLVSLMLLISYAIPDTTAVIESHNDSTVAHPDIRDTITEVKEETEDMADTVLSIRIHQQGMDKKLDKILEKLDN
jgi:hypothetical protein